jgi:antitoxin HicB
MVFKKTHMGSSFDDFMESEELATEVNAIAVKRVLAFKLKEAMEKKGLNKSQMAEKMHTSRSALERFLDPNNISITLATMEKAARAIGKRLEIKLKSA